VDLGIKWDGYRAEAVNSGGNLFLLSWRQKSFSKQFPLIHEAFGDLPNDTVVEGEIVPLDESGRPDFKLLQNFRSAAKQINYFLFDLLVLKGQRCKIVPPAFSAHHPGDPNVQESVLLRELQREIQRHDLSTFIDEPPSGAQGGRGVVVPGCPACRKRFGTVSQFIDHLTNDVLPAIVSKLSAQG